MEPGSYFKTTCAHCGGHIEAPSEGEGVWIRCPHCGEKTQLTETPTTTTQIASAKKSMVWIWIVVLAVVVVGAGAGLALFKRSRSNTPQTPTNVEAAKAVPARVVQQEPEPDLWKGLKPGPVTIEKSSKSRLVYAFVTIRNDTNKQKFGVKVTLDILDAQGEKLGTTGDYTQFIDAHKEWTAKAIVAFPKAATAKIASISEE
jgi:DNA-directed RNA polymerase subunit RPC12/RpoP